MSTIEQVLLQRLESTSELTNLVDTRIYPQIAPQQAIMPFVIYARENSESYHNFGQTLPETRCIYSFTSFAKTYSQARAITESIRKTFNFWKAAGPPEVVLTRLLNDYDAIQETADGSLIVYSSVMDIEVIYRHND